VRVEGIRRLRKTSGVYHRFQDTGERERKQTDREREKANFDHEVEFCGFFFFVLLSLTRTRRSIVMYELIFNLDWTRKDFGYSGERNRCRWNEFSRDLWGLRLHEEERDHIEIHTHITTIKRRKKRKEKEKKKND